METFIKIVSVILLVVYIFIAIWVICNQEGWKKSLGASLGFLAGGGIIIPVAYYAAVVICYAIAGVLVITFFLAIFGAFN